VSRQDKSDDLCGMVEERGIASLVVRSADVYWSLDAGELWRYRELLYFLAWRDIKVRYKQTILGVLWAVLQPVAISFTLTLFLGNLVRVPSNGLPYVVFAFCAMSIWQLFCNILTETSNCLISNEPLISKVYCPRLIIPLSVVLASLPDFLISIGILALFLAHYRVALSASVWVAPLVVLLNILIAMGVGLWLAALNVKYRDVRYTVGFLIQLWLFASPVAYPSSVVPDRWRYWYGLNPLVGVVEGFRWAITGRGPPPLDLLGVSTCVAVVLLLSGLYFFRRTEGTFADFI